MPRKSRASTAGDGRSTTPTVELLNPQPHSRKRKAVAAPAPPLQAVSASPTQTVPAPALMVPPPKATPVSAATTTACQPLSECPIEASPLSELFARAQGTPCLHCRESKPPLGSSVLLTTAVTNQACTDVRDRNHERASRCDCVGFNAADESEADALVAKRPDAGPARLAVGRQTHASCSRWKRE